MTRSNGRNGNKPPPQTRAAIYTRVSTPVQADGDFTSIDNQREACEAYVASQKGQGWVCLPDRYDDVGFSGGTLDRPALDTLLSDIAAGRVGVVVCYKLDRLTRSLLDFAKLVEVLDRHGVSFVSVTQPINTADSTGRLMLNILLSFAQFERETIADRTRDKMSAARKKGKWTGGLPVLGYRVHPDGGKLEIDPDEAEMVRAIFTLYLDRKSLLAVAEVLNRRGWVTKSWVTKTGKTWGGKPWTKTNVHTVLTNPLYVGQVRHKGNLYPGEHDAIIMKRVWSRAQALLSENRQCGGARAKNRYGFLLRGLLRCSACGTSYSPSTTKKNSRVYRYYTCSSAQKLGWHTCPQPSLQAKKMEDLIVDQIRVIGQDRALVRETVKQVQVGQREKKSALVAEQRRLTRERDKARSDINALLDALASGQVGGPSLSDRLGELEERAAKLDRRLAEIQADLSALDAATVNPNDVATALSLFDPIWDVLFPMEQERIIQLLIARIEYDGKTGKLAVEFAPTGIKSLAGEIDEAREVAS